jgi:hypothetical protein
MAKIIKFPGPSSDLVDDLADHYRNLARPGTDVTLSAQEVARVATVLEFLARALAINRELAEELQRVSTPWSGRRFAAAICLGAIAGVGFRLGLDHIALIF